MLQQMMTLSAASRTTSYSSSFQPLRLFSMSTWGLSERLLAERSLSSSAFSAKPDPRPPSEKAERRMTGYPIRSAATSASLTVETAVELAAGMPISARVRCGARSAFALAELRRNVWFARRGAWAERGQA